MWEMHDWYFKSGICLSHSSRRSLFELKKCIIFNLNKKGIDIKEIIGEKEKDPKVRLSFDAAGPLPDPAPTNRCNLASELRTSLANDIGVEENLSSKLL